MLSRELTAAAQQMLGRLPNEQELQDPQFMQRLMYAADQGNAPDAGVRQNLSWVDDLMKPAPDVDTPVANTSMRGGKGDRADVQEAPLPPSRPNDVGIPRNGEVAEAVAGNGQPSETQAPKGTAEGLASFPSGVAAQRDYAPSDDALAQPNVGGKASADGRGAAAIGGTDYSYLNEPPPTEEAPAEVPAKSGWRDAVASTWDMLTKPNLSKDVVAKLKAANIDPSKIGAREAVRMLSMGVDRWIAKEAGRQ